MLLNNLEKIFGFNSFPCLGNSIDEINTPIAIKLAKDSIIFNSKPLWSSWLVIGKTEGHLDQSIFFRDILNIKNDVYE